MSGNPEVEFLIALIHQIDHLRLAPSETCNQCAKLRADARAMRQEHENGGHDAA